MSDALLQFLGRLHPLVLHLPIGLLIGLVFVDALGWIRRQPLDAALRQALAWLAAASAIAAAGSGLLLSQEDGYVADAVDQHKWLGIAVASVALLTASLSHAARWRRAYAVALGIAVALLFPTGHLGAGLTHGDAFLFEPFDQPTPAAATEERESLGEYATVVASIFAQRCGSCHGAVRRKGGLALHTPETLLAGGADGPVIVPGDVQASEVIRRLRAPLDAEDHMPPAGKQQPSVAEIAAIEQWIAAGASFGDFSAPPATQPMRTDDQAERLLGPPPYAALEALRERLVHVETIDPRSGRLWIDFSAVPDVTDEDVITLLDPLRGHVVELSLARTAVTDAVLESVADLPRLERLDVSATAVTANGIAACQRASALAWLNLAGTSLDDAAAKQLAQLPSLEWVNVWQTGLAPHAIEALLEKRTDLRIVTGSDLAAAASETEPELRFSSDAPIPSVAAPISLEPENERCPVSGKPVDKRFAILYDSRVIAFCCPNCAAEFWAAPQASTAPQPPSTAPQAPVAAEAEADPARPRPVEPP
jgi:mono/diheme cytochrome c family protein